MAPSPKGLAAGARVVSSVVTGAGEAVELLSSWWRSDRCTVTPASGEHRSALAGVCEHKKRHRAGPAAGGSDPKVTVTDDNPRNIEADDWRPISISTWSAVRCCWPRSLVVLLRPGPGSIINIASVTCTCHCLAWSATAPPRRRAVAVVFRLANEPQGRPRQHHHAGLLPCWAEQKVTQRRWYPTERAAQIPAARHGSLRKASWSVRRLLGQPQRRLCHRRRHRVDGGFLAQTI